MRIERAHVRRDGCCYNYKGPGEHGDEEARLVRSWSLLLLGILACLNLLSTESAHATQIVDAWDVLVGVQDSEGQFQQNFSRFNQVQPSPWLADHTAALGASSTVAQYNFNYAGDSATFHIDTHQQCQRVVGEVPRCIASGFVNVVPAVDTLVTMEGAFTYTMNSDPMSANIVGNVVTLEPQQIYFQDGASAFSFLDPPQGTLSIGASALLPGGAGVIFRLGYGFQLLADDDNAPGSLMTGNGSIEFVLTPIPEPFSFVLLALGLLSASRRRRALSRRYLYNPVRG